MVGGKNRHERRASIGIETRINGKARARIGEKMAGVALNNVIGLRDPIGVGKRFGKRRECIGGQSQRGFQLRFFRDNSFVPAALLMSQTQHFFGRFKQV